MLLRIKESFFRRQEYFVTQYKDKELDFIFSNISMNNKNYIIALYALSLA